MCVSFFVFIWVFFVVGEFKGNILVVCAHSDDQVLGPGGAMARFAREGFNVFTVIFSYGELSHPHLKRSYVARVRVKESRVADRIIGGSGVFFLGLKDGALREDFMRKGMFVKLSDLFLKFDPVMVFTHSSDDLLPDHRFVRDCVLEVYDSLAVRGFGCEVYSFDVWNLWNVLKRGDAKLVVDVSRYFHFKVRALREFKSQINFFSHTFLVNFLFVGVFVKAFINGLRYGFRRVEVFFRLR